MRRSATPRSITTDARSAESRIARGVSDLSGMRTSPWLLRSMQRRCDRSVPRGSGESRIALAYNLANFLRQLLLPKPIRGWTLTALHEKLIKIGAKVVSHSTCRSRNQGCRGWWPSRPYDQVFGDLK